MWVILWRNSAYTFFYFNNSKTMYFFPIGRKILVLGYPALFSGHVYYFENKTAHVVVTKNLKAHISVSTY